MIGITAIATQSFSLSRQKGYWSFSKAWRALVRIPRLLAYWPTQLVIFWMLLSPNLRKLSLKQPILPFKYLRTNYLVKGLTISARASALVHNYRYLLNTLGDEFLHKVLYDRAVLFESSEENHRYSVDLSLSSPCYNEGELTLTFKSADQVLYLLSFTFVPGEIVGSSASTVILVSRLQGTYGCYPQIREAMKALNGISLPMFLMIALEGIAEAFDIYHLAGVAGAMQHKSSDTQIDTFQNVYDNFFVAAGATKGASGFYCSILPLQEKSLNLVNSCNRCRSKVQRKLKRQVAREVYFLLRENKKRRCSDTYSRLARQVALLDRNLSIINAEPSW